MEEIFLKMKLILSNELLYLYNLKGKFKFKLLGKGL